MTIKARLNTMDEITRRNDERLRAWARDHRATPAQRIMTTLRYRLPDIIAGVAAWALVILIAATI